MDLGTAMETLKELLDVSDERLSPTVQLLKFNEAIRSLENLYETPFTEGAGAAALTEAHAGVMDLMTMFSSSGEGTYDDLLVTSIQTAHYVNDAGSAVFLVGTTYDELDANYPRAVYELSPGLPLAFAQRGVKLHLRPWPNAAIGPVMIHFAYLGHTKPLVVDADTHPWLEYAPYVLLYEAAALASIHLIEEERAQVFRSLRDEAAEATAVTLRMHKADQTQIAMEPMR